MKKIAHEDLKEHIDSGKDFFLLDALPIESYQKEHLPRARSMPSDMVSELAPKTLRDKSQMIVIYCGNTACPRSREAAEKLAQIGYTNIFEYEGGLEEWRTKGLPLESHTPAEGTYGTGQIKRTVGSSAA